MKLTGSIKSSASSIEPFALDMAALVMGVRPVKMIFPVHVQHKEQRRQGVGRPDQEPEQPRSVFEVIGRGLQGC